MKSAVFSWMRVLGSAWVVVTLTTFYSTPGHASQTGSTPAKAPFPWADSDTRRDCGQDCIYKKVNENLSTESIYTLRKLVDLKSAVASGDESALRGIVGDFCRGTGGSWADLEACADRYRVMQLIRLSKIRAAMAEHREMVTRLSSRRPNLHGGWDGRQQVILGDSEPQGTPGAAGLPGSPASQGKKPILPHVPDLKELESDYQRLRALSSTDYEAWLRTFPTEPSKEDFIKYKEIPRDPSNPEGEKLTIVVTGQDGKPEYDEDSYAKAVSLYKAFAVDLKADMQRMVVDRDGRPDHLNRERPEWKDAVTSESLDAYQVSREIMIKTANEAISGKKDAESSAGGGALSPKGGPASGKQDSSGSVPTDKVIDAPVGPKSRNIFIQITSKDLQEAMEQVLK